MHGWVGTSAICHGGPRVSFEIDDDKFGAANEYSRLFDEGMRSVDGPAVDRGAVVAAEVYSPPVTVAAFKCGVMARDQWIVGQCNKIVCLSSDGYVRTDDHSGARGVETLDLHALSAAVQADKRRVVPEEHELPVAVGRRKSNTGDGGEPSARSIAHGDGIARRAEVGVLVVRFDRPA